MKRSCVFLVFFVSTVLCSTLSQSQTDFGRQTSGPYGGIGLFDPSNSTRRSLDGTDGLDLVRLGDNEQTNRLASSWLRKPLTASFGLGGFVIIIDVSLRYQITRSIDIGASAFSSLAVLAYEAQGFMLSGRIYFQPEQKFTPFVLLGGGPLWKKEQGEWVLSGALVAIQFGWEYITHVGFTIFAAVGPITQFVLGEGPAIGIFQLGIGWNF